MTRNPFERPKLTSAHLIAVAALVVGMAGSATAAALITSADIKDNTVTTIDIKDKSLKLKDIKPSERDKLNGNTGPQGPIGPQGLIGPQGGVGPAGASAFAPPPAGTLVVGGGLIAGYVAIESGQLTGYSALGFTPAAPLSEEDPTRNVYFAPHASVIDSNENGTLCPGSAAAPDATPGITCLYVAATTNIEANSAAVYAGVTAGAEGADGHGFHVTPDSDFGGQTIFRYVWAYKAP